MNRIDLQDKTDEEVKALADAGEYIAIFEYGIRLFNQERYRESYEYLKQIEKYDNFLVWERIVDIAYYYEKDLLADKEIFDLLTKIHNKWASSYTYILADFYRDGRGVEKDLKKYVELLRECANDGSCYAVAELARCYEEGIGVRKSLKEAFKIYYYFYDEHGKMDYWCAYRVAIYMLNEWGGAKKDMKEIKYYLNYAARGNREAKKLYIELFNEEPNY